MNERWLIFHAQPMLQMVLPPTWFLFPLFYHKNASFVKTFCSILQTCFVANSSYKACLNNSHDFFKKKKKTPILSHRPALSDELKVISYWLKDKRMATKFLYSAKHLDGLSTRVSVLSLFHLSLFLLWSGVRKRGFWSMRNWGQSEI